MSCEKCGRPAENGTPAHWLGCASVPMLAPNPAYRTQDATTELAGGPAGALHLCELASCFNEKRPQGKGPKPKYCTDHSTPKSRKE